MGWVFFQVFLAFGVGVLIVWWTWPKSKKPHKGTDATANGPVADEKK